MKGWDFTLEKYRMLCKELISENYLILTIKDYLLADLNAKTKVVILRHDVDRNPKNAVGVAEVENQLGISSTYYFRSIQSVFKPEIMKHVEEMGHEVGYHYETLSKEKGNYEKAIQLFESELSSFREIVDIKTICMHGNPLSPWDNRNLWNKYNYEAYGLLGEAYLSLDYSSLIYFTDTGRAWNAKRLNVRDRVVFPNPHEVSSTGDLIRVIRSNTIRKMCVQTHPERWNSSFYRWFFSLLQDNLFNIIKVFLSLTFHYNSQIGSK